MDCFLILAIFGAALLGMLKTDNLLSGYSFIGY